MLRKLLPPLKPDKFAKAVIAALRDVGLEGPFKYDAAEFAIHVQPEVGSQTVFLDNLYREYCAVPVRHRKATIAQYVASILAGTRPMPDTFAEAKDRLLPQVRSRTWYDQLRRLDCQAVVPFQPIGDHLVATIAYDTPEAISTVQQNQLDGWRVSFDSAFASARDNLWKISNEDFRELGTGVYASPWQDNHDVSRLALPDLIRQLKVDGRHVAFVPTRDFLFVTGSDNVDALGILAKRVEENLDIPHAVSGLPLILDGTAWRTYLPEPNHAAFDVINNLRRMDVALEYAYQKNALEKDYQDLGENIFVATAMLAEQEKTGKRRLVTTWSRGVHAVLPQCDEVCFVKHPDDKDMMMVDWDRVVEVVGDLLVPVGTYPERFEVRDFPTEEQLRSMAS